MVDKNVAEEWYKDIIKRHKTAFLREWDPTLTGDAFGDFFPTKRSRTDFSIMSNPDVLPHWVERANLNRQAKNIMLSYLNGSYFLDPVELYRLSAGLGNTSMGNMPDVHTIGNRVNSLWRGVDGYKIDPQGQWYLPKKPYRKSTNEHSDQLRARDAKETLRKELENLCK